LVPYLLRKYMHNKNKKKTFQYSTKKYNKRIKKSKLFKQKKEVIQKRERTIQNVLKVNQQYLGLLNRLATRSLNNWGGMFSSVFSSSSIKSRAHNLS